MEEVHYTDNIRTIKLQYLKTEIEILKMMDSEISVGEYYARIKELLNQMKLCGYFDGKKLVDKLLIIIRVLKNI